MTSAALAFGYVLFVWWFSTGLVFLVVLRSRRVPHVSVIGAALLVPLSLYGLELSGDDQSVFGAYSAFTAALVLWGAQEIGFLTGFVTGPRPRACPPGLSTPHRALYAVSAILYHEVALLLSGIAVAAVTWGAPNQVGGAAFLVLWVMRVSAKLNLFLGVPALHDEMMPDALAFLRSYFVRGPVNKLYVPALLLAGLATAWLVWSAVAAPTDAARAGDWLLATLLALAILEHGFMVVRLPIERLWRWSTGAMRPARRGPDVGTTKRHELTAIEGSLPT